MKNTGFTLAEALVTLSIIGVIASLTLPVLNIDSRNAQLSSALTVNAANIENAFKSAISGEGVASLFDTKMWNVATIPAFVGNLGVHLSINGFINGSEFDYYNNKQKTIHNMSANGSMDAATRESFPGEGVCHPIELKTGATMFIRIFGRKAEDTEARKDAIIAAGGTMYDNSADVFIDVNGVKPPNTLGRDIFGFKVDGKGSLHALGSLSVSIYDNLDTRDTWDNNGAYSCPNNAAKSNGGIGCTARLISNGYKFDY